MSGPDFISGRMRAPHLVKHVKSFHRHLRHCFLETQGCDDIAIGRPIRRPRGAL